MKGMVLVPLDGSQQAERAVAPALRIAVQAGSRLRLVHVHVPAGAHFVSAPPIDTWRVDFETMDEAEAYMASLLDRTTDRGCRAIITADVLRGEVLDALLHETRKRDVGLIVMSTHGRTGIRAAVAGSVATSVLRESRAPVLVCGPALAARPPAHGTSADTPTLAAVLVSLDGSPEAESVIPHAYSIARLFDGRMTLLAVAARPDIGIGMIGAPTGAAAQIADERELALYLDRLCDRLAQAGWPVNRRVMRSDQIPAAILRAAAEDDADVIAMATHGLGAAARALFGSVTAEVVRSSRLPVLIWRPAQS